MKDQSQSNKLTILNAEQDPAGTARLHRLYHETAGLLAEKWGLPPPQDLVMYWMSENWFSDILAAAPWTWRILLVIVSPLWYFRISRMWSYVGGWQQRFGRRCVVGVKPASLLEASDRSIGQRIYLPEPDLEVRVEELTCHELTHAFTSRLRLPAWLNEGLAMLSVDFKMGKPTIKPETLSALAQTGGEPGTASYRKIDLRNPDRAVYIYVRGYWITRYFEETHHGVLKRLLGQRFSRNMLQDQLAKAVGMDPQQFWSRIDRLVVDHYSVGG